MLFTQLGSALMLASFAKAFTIPLGTGDGLYIAQTFEDGTEEHTRISDINVAGNLTTEAEVLEARGSNGEVWCGCGYTLDPSNCDSAVAALKTQLDRMNYPELDDLHHFSKLTSDPEHPVPPGLSFYSITGSVVAFACNQDTNSDYWTTSGSTYAASLSIITSACGRYIAGTRELAQTGNGGAYDQLVWGYMRYSNGLNFCQTSTSSPSSSC